MSTRLLKYQRPVFRFHAVPKGFSYGTFDIAQSSINISKKRLGYSKFKENEDFGHSMVSKLTSAKNNQSHFKTKILENFFTLELTCCTRKEL